MGGMRTGHRGQRMPNEATSGGIAVRRTMENKPGTARITPFRYGSWPPGMNQQ